MTTFILDVILYILLLAAVGFGAISVIGLLLFPDIRSRSFTGLRAGLLATTLITIAGVCYSTNAYITTGESQYPLFAVTSIVMLVLLFILNKIATNIVCRHSYPFIHPSSDKEKES